MEQATKASPKRIKEHQAKRRLMMIRHACKDARKGVIHRVANRLTAFYISLDNSFGG